MKTGIDVLWAVPAQYFTGERWITVKDLCGEDDLKRLVEKKAITCHFLVGYEQNAWDKDKEFMLKEKL